MILFETRFASGPAPAVAAFISMALAGCGQGHPPAHASPAATLRPASPVARAATPGSGDAFVSDTLPMGYWLSLHNRLKRPQGDAAPKGVIPDLTFGLDEGTENLMTDFGEQLARSATGEPSYRDCLNAAYSTDDLVDVPRLPPGSWFCSRDKSGRLAKIRIDGVDENNAALRLAYLVWK